MATKKIITFLSHMSRKNITKELNYFCSYCLFLLMKQLMKQLKIRGTAQKRFLIYLLPKNHSRQREGGPPMPT